MDAMGSGNFMTVRYTSSALHVQCVVQGLLAYWHSWLKPSVVGGYTRLMHSFLLNKRNQLLLVNIGNVFKHLSTS